MLAKGESSEHEINLFYGSKAVAILRAAQANERFALGLAVSPQFTFTATDGDNIKVPRNKLGIDAAIDLATIIKPASFRIETIYSGPLVLAPRRCEWTVRVIFDSARSPNAWPDGWAINFTFSNDQLVSAKGESVQVFAGKTSSPPN